jgi:riboflavin synthase
MFSGIIEETGRVAAFGPAPGGWRLRVAARVAREGLAVGDSVAVNGCCLTVVDLPEGGIAFDLLDETRRLTGFSSMRADASVNLERSLKFDGRVGGHFVTGHVDGTGRVEAFERRGNDRHLRVSLPAGGEGLVVPKGSITIDGVALTVAEAGPGTASVWLIPHTLAATNLAERAAGDAVNIEFDLLGKYVRSLLSAQLARPQPCAQP